MKNNKIHKAFHYIKNRIRLSFKESHCGRLRYIYEKTGSDALVIVFSGFGTVRKYNYMKTFENAHVDKLFILDTFGYKGSYYWFEKGGNKPMLLTTRVIQRIRGGYKRVYTAGSSKGGTCAIYYGLMFNVDEVFASACQYHVGQYLNQPVCQKIMKSMVGRHYDENDIKMVDDELPNMIRAKANSSTVIHLFYSEKDSTYREHIVDLMADLDSNGIKYTTTVDDYIKHGDNGIYFKQHLLRIFSKDF